MPAVGSGRQATQVSSHDAHFQGSLPVIDFLERKHREGRYRKVLLCCFALMQSEEARPDGTWKEAIRPACRASSCIVVPRRASNGMSSEEYMQDRCGRMRSLNTIGPEVPFRRSLLSACGRGQVIQ